MSVPRQTWVLAVLMSLVLVVEARSQQVQGKPVTSTFVSYRRPEVFFVIGRGDYLSDYWFPPAWVNVGGGIGTRLSRRFGVEFEVNRMLGVSPWTVTGVAFIPNRPGSRTEFSGREGFTSMTVAAGSLLYYFRDKRVQPFLSAGVGVALERGVTYHYPSEEEFQKTESLGTFGGGLKVFVSERIAVRPEFRVSIPAGPDRASIGVMYSW